ncbi:MAG: ACP phosphodiesterase [Burkholderiales bacterium]|nr:ACP phosphodiesterase [Burkholderiales bacterium]
MNYLAHLYLSPPDEDAWLGSLLGDFVKGEIGERYAPPVAAAIRLHRRLDAYTDAHAAVRRSRMRVSGARRRYAGIMIDMFYDHFLARGWDEFHDEPLPVFAARVYALLERRRAELPERLQSIAPRMAARDWLGAYARVENVARALEGIGTRLRRANRLAGAGEELLAAYAGFEADFRAFLPEAKAFAARGGGTSS